MAGVQCVKLNNLNINLQNALIIGIIIAKNSHRKIGSKKKNGDSRGVMSFTLRDSKVDTINVDVWGSEYFVITFYERFVVGDVVEITSPKICIKSGDNEFYRPHVSFGDRCSFICKVTSPFYLSLNEGISDVGIFTGDDVGTYLPLLHIPSKPSSGYCGLAEVMKFQENENVYVDLLVVVKSVKPVRTIRTKAGIEISLRSIEVMDNTTPASVLLDTFDIDTIQRAEDWRPLESVLFVADARVSFRGRALSLQACARTVLTHQPHTPDAETLRLYIQNQTNTRGWEAGAWSSWSGERAAAATVAQVRDRLAQCAPFSAALHALLTHLDLDDLPAIGSNSSNSEELRVRFADHTGELSAYIPVSVLEDALGLTAEQARGLSSEARAAVRWRLLLEQCSARVVAAPCPPRLLVLALRRASPADPLPLY